MLPEQHRHVEKNCAYDKASLWIPDKRGSNWLGGQHELKLVVLGDRNGIVLVATNLATLNGEACCSHGVVVRAELHWKP